MIDVEIEGEDALLAGLRRAQTGLSDERVPLDKAGHELAESIGRRMEAGGDYPDITPASRKRRKKDKTAPALIDTRALLEAASATTEQTTNSIYDLEPTVLTKGVSGPSVRRLAKGFHGTDSKGRHIDQPARDFMSATPADEAAATGILERYVDSLLEPLE